MHRIRLANEAVEGRNDDSLFSGDGPTVLVDHGVVAGDVRSRLRVGLAGRADRRR